MSRRAASFTQADAARALRAAQQAGPDWSIEIEAGVIRFVRSAAPSEPATVEPPPEAPAAVAAVAEPEWSF
jgi:hypothetical protein